jgi:hypothetical protein
LFRISLQGLSHFHVARRNDNQHIDLLGQIRPGPGLIRFSLYRKTPCKAAPREGEDYRLDWTAAGAGADAGGGAVISWPSIFS